MSRIMVTLTGPFTDGDPGTAPMRTFTVGDPDPAALARRVAEWAHDQTLRAVCGDDVPPGVEVTEEDARAFDEYLKGQERLWQDDAA